mgnify:CR=1 FL=1
MIHLISLPNQFFLIQLNFLRLDQEYFSKVEIFVIQADSIVSSKNALESSKNIKFTRNSQKRTTLLAEFSDSNELSLHRRKSNLSFEPIKKRSSLETSFCNLLQIQESNSETQNKNRYTEG